MYISEVFLYKPYELPENNLINGLQIGAVLLLVTWIPVMKKRTHAAVATLVTNLFPSFAC